MFEQLMSLLAVQLANFVTGLAIAVQIGVLVHVAIALVPNLLLVGFSFQEGIAFNAGSCLPVMS